MFYVSYDGAAEPLGQSQVLPYLKRLAADFDVTLISFEKPAADEDRVSSQLENAGIRWVPLRYHRRPPVLSTVLDLRAASGALKRLAASGKPDVVHVRSYVPALMALSAQPKTGGRLLFDIRGFWADERVEGGLWRRGALYRLAKHYERRFFRSADAIVTLTHASIPQIRAWLGGREVPVEVVPTCVDLERFVERPRRPGGPHAVWSGSIGTWYRFDLAPKLVAALGTPLTVLTRERELARTTLGEQPATVRTVAPEEIPSELFAGDIGLCLIASSFSKIASAPTRFAEYLASGMPVVVTPGVGDLAEIVERERVGVVMRGEDAGAIAKAAERIRDLASEPEIADRCRAVARSLFDVDAGADRYRELYQRLIAAG